MSHFHTNTYYPNHSIRRFPETYNHDCWTTTVLCKNDSHERVVHPSFAICPVDCGEYRNLQVPHSRQLNAGQGSVLQLLFTLCIFMMPPT